MTILFFVLPLLILFAVFYPAIFSDSLFGNGDTLYSFYPYYDYFASGGPLVAQELLSGFPVYVSNVGLWFSWTFYLALKWFDAFDAYRYLVVFYLILAYLATYGLGRLIKLNHWSAIFAATTFVFSGQLMIWAPTLSNASYYFILPATLLLSELFYQSGRLFRWLLPLLAGFLLGLGWQNSHVQYLIFIHLFIAIYLLWRLWPLLIKCKWRALWPYVVYLTSAYLVSLIVGLKQIQAILIWSDQSARASGVALSEWLGGSYGPFDLIHLFNPFWDHLFIPLSSPGWYIGILPLVLVLLFIRHYHRWGDSYSSFFLGTWLFCVVASLTYSPLAVALHYLPLIDSLREAARLMFIGNLGAALVSAKALERLTTDRPDYRLWVIKGRNYLIGPLIIITGLLTFIYQVFNNWLLHQSGRLFEWWSLNSLGPNSREYYLKVFNQAVEQLIYHSSWFSQGTLVALISLVFISCWFYYLGKYSSKNISLVALMILLFGFAGTYIGHYQFVSRGVLKSNPSTASFIKQQTKPADGPFRVFSLWPGFTIYDLSREGCVLDEEGTKSYELAKELLLPNSNLLYGIEMIDGYDNFMPQKISQLNAFIGSEQAVTGNLLANAPISKEEKIKIIAARANLLKALNIRYLLSYYPLPATFPLIREFDLSYCERKVGLYENPGYWPRYFWANSVTEIAPADFSNFEFMSDRLVGAAKPIVLLEGITTSSIIDYPITKSLIPKIGYDYLTFDVSQLTGGYVFIGNSIAPGWRAYIDGQPATVRPANYAYLAVSLPPNSQTLILKADYLFNDN